MEFYNFSNGLRLVYQFFDTPLSYCGVVVGSGSRHELESEWGVAHMVEHMLFKGTTRRSYIEMLDYVEGVGGDMNAFTSKEDMCIYVSILNKYFHRSVDVLSDVCFNSLFLQSDIDKEKGVIIDEINSYLDSPAEAIIDDFDDRIFSASLGRNILGSEASVQSMDKEMLTGYYRRNYVPSNIVFSYTGGLPFQEVVAVVQQWFGSYGGNIQLPASEVFLMPTFNKTIKKKTFQSHCVYGRAAVGAYHDDRLYYILLNSILGGESFNSLLNISLREENGLTYNIDSTYSAYSDYGLFAIYFGTDSTKLNQCLDIISGLFKSFQNAEFPEDWFQKRKLQFIGQVALHFDGLSSVMLANGKSLSVYGECDNYEQICAKVEALEYSRFVELSKAFLDPVHFSALIYK
jgi:predicted Zn-dependent peptidase